MLCESPSKHSTSSIPDTSLSRRGGRGALKPEKAGLRLFRNLAGFRYEPAGAAVAAASTA